MTQHSSNTGYATLDLYNPFESTTAVSYIASNIQYNFTCDILNKTVLIDDVDYRVLISLSVL